MKKIILLTLTALMMVGCFNDNDEYKAPYKNGGLSSHLTGADMCTVIIDSCEYSQKETAYEAVSLQE